MTDIELAKAELNTLRGYQENGSLALHKEALDALYWRVCNKHLPTCKCKNRMDDAIYEIYAKLNNPKITEIMACKAKLVQGVALLHVPQFDGVVYTNYNLTDEVARAFLKARPDRKSWFEILPDEEEQEQPQPKKRTRKAK